uniref:Uncharacterized protein n=1 Tax=Aegilops tauschii TaxID=37682 RepID=M8BV18_AEGTA
MPPVGGGDDYTEQDSPQATGHHGCPEDVSSSSPTLPVIASIASEKKKQRRDREQQPAASLPDDVIIEILSRVHYKSLCRFKCGSKQWLDLCSGLDTHKRSPQALSGLYFLDEEHQGLSFHGLTGGGPRLVDPDLSFLRKSYESLEVTQCSSSLLLCMCWKNSYSPRGECDYVVCNPATEKWTLLPPIECMDQADVERYLGFDAVKPSSFVVVAPLTDIYQLIRKVAIYSSGTERWTYVESGWASDTMVGDQDAIFLNGIVHLTTCGSSIVTVDIEGKIWREIRVPHFDAIGLSQGCLHAWRVDVLNGCQLSLWVLQDYDSENWTLKHTVNVLELFGSHCRKDHESYMVLAIHLNCNLIFLTDGEMTVLYDTDNRKVNVISSSVDFVGCAPYIPCFTKWLSDGR